MHDNRPNDYHACRVLGLVSINHHLDGLVQLSDGKMSDFLIDKT